MARVADIDSLDVRLFHQCRRIAFVAKQRLAAAGEQQPENVWLIGAVALSLFTHVLVIYVPFLQTAFNTVALSMFDWAIVTGVAATLLIGMEVVKFGLRMERRAVLRLCCIATGGHAAMPLVQH
jgi:hypothetical protein